MSSSGTAAASSSASPLGLMSSPSAAMAVGVDIKGGRGGSGDGERCVPRKLHHRHRSKENGMGRRVNAAAVVTTTTVVTDDAAAGGMGATQKTAKKKKKKMKRATMVFDTAAGSAEPADESAQTAKVESTNDAYHGGRADPTKLMATKKKKKKKERERAADVDPVGKAGPLGETSQLMHDTICFAPESGIDSAHIAKKKEGNMEGKEEMLHDDAVRGAEVESTAEPANTISRDVIDHPDAANISRPPLAQIRTKKKKERRATLVHESAAGITVRADEIAPKDTVESMDDAYHNGTADPTHFVATKKKKKKKKRLRAADADAIGKAGTMGETTKLVKEKNDAAPASGIETASVAKKDGKIKAKEKMLRDDVVRGAEAEATAESAKIMNRNAIDHPDAANISQPPLSRKKKKKKRKRVDDATEDMAESTKTKKTTFDDTGVADVSSSAPLQIAAKTERGQVHPDPVGGVKAPIEIMKATKTEAINKASTNRAKPAPTQKTKKKKKKKEEKVKDAEKDSAELITETMKMESETDAVAGGSEPIHISLKDGKKKDRADRGIADDSNASEEAMLKVKKENFGGAAVVGTEEGAREAGMKVVSTSNAAGGTPSPHTSNPASSARDKSKRGGGQKKRKGPWDIKVGSVVSIRHCGRRNVTAEPIVGACCPFDSNEHSFGEAVEKEGVVPRIRAQSEAFQQKGTPPDIDVWLDPIAGKDDGLALVGQRISFPRSCIMTTSKPPNGDTVSSKNGKRTREDKRWVDGEVVAVQYPPTTEQNERGEVVCGVLVEKAALAAAPNGGDPSRPSGGGNQERSCHGGERGNKTVPVQVILRALHKHCETAASPPWKILKAATVPRHTADGSAGYTCWPKRRKRPREEIDGGHGPGSSIATVVSPATVQNGNDGPNEHEAGAENNGIGMKNTPRSGGALPKNSFAGDRWYVGDSFDTPRQQEKNWLWLLNYARRRRPMAGGGNADKSLVAAAGRVGLEAYGVEASFVGQVVAFVPPFSPSKVVSSPPAADGIATSPPKSEQTIVLLKRLWMPEQTMGGRRHHQHGILEMFDDIGRSTHKTNASSTVLYRVPLDDVIVLGKSVVRCSPHEVAAECLRTMNAGGRSRPPLVVASSYSTDLDVYCPALPLNGSDRFPDSAATSSADGVEKAKFDGSSCDENSRQQQQRLLSASLALGLGDANGDGPEEMLMQLDASERLAIVCHSCRRVHQTPGDSVKASATPKIHMCSSHGMCYRKCDTLSPSWWCESCCRKCARTSAGFGGTCFHPKARPKETWTGPCCLGLCDCDACRRIHCCFVTQQCRFSEDDRGLFGGCLMGCIDDAMKRPKWPTEEYSKTTEKTITAPAVGGAATASRVDPGEQRSTSQKDVIIRTCSICLHHCAHHGTEAREATTDQLSSTCHTCDRTTHAKCAAWEKLLIRLNLSRRKEVKDISSPLQSVKCATQQEGIGSKGGVRRVHVQKTNDMEEGHCERNNGSSSKRGIPVQGGKMGLQLHTPDTSTKQSEAIPPGAYQCWRCIASKGSGYCASTIGMSEAISSVQFHLGTGKGHRSKERVFFHMLGDTLEEWGPLNFDLPANFEDQLPVPSDKPRSKMQRRKLTKEGTGRPLKRITAQQKLKDAKRKKKALTERLHDHKRPRQDDVGDGVPQPNHFNDEGEQAQSLEMTCCRILPYDPNRKSMFDASLHQQSASSSSICARLATHQHGGSMVRCSETYGRKDKAQKASGRAARANQRRMLKDVAVFGSMGLGLDSLSGREPRLRFGRSTIHRWGVFAEEDLNSGDMILEYKGELIGNAVADAREKQYEKAKIGSDYMFRMDSTTVCDATKQGSVARFINASCCPNCYTQIINVKGCKRIVIYAKRDICAGEELSYDYKFPVEYDETKRVRCNCGSPDCRGFMNWDKRYVAIPVNNEKR